MMSPHDTARHPAPAYPVQAWYVAATSDEVTTEPVSRRVLDTGLVFYRGANGMPVALEDRDAHRPYPLSLGRVEGDVIISSYSGFAYGPDGTCVHVPTQTEVPFDARVRAYPVQELDGLIWVWLANPGLAELRRPPRAPWLADDQWVTFGGGWTTQASFLLLHENFADITHVAVIDPELAPPVLSLGPVPLLEVEVTETSVSFTRDYPPATLAPWHADLLGVGTEALFVQRELGRFVSPGMWVDSWAVDGDHLGGSTATFRFTHAVTPVGRASTRHGWWVSRNFAPGADVSANLHARFERYYRQVHEILETMQGVLSADGPRADVGVTADAAALQVRRIVNRLVAEERVG